jgi:methyl coenzyme M reductase subunit C
LTTALLVTAEIVPGVIEEFRQDAHQASEELKRKNSANPADTFTAGIIIGLVAGAVTATKVISDKINNP